MKYHFMRDMVDNDIIKLRYCNTLDNIIDIFIKGVVKNIFLNIRSLLVIPLNINRENVGKLILVPTSKSDFSTLCLERQCISLQM